MDESKKLPAFLTRDAAGTVRITGTPYTLAEIVAAADLPEWAVSNLFPALTLANLHQLREWVKANQTKPAE